MKELWKDIDGYEGLYQVSSIGRIKSCDKIVDGSYNSKHHIKEKILKPFKTGSGYIALSIRLYKNGIGKDYRISRLVAKAFILNPENKLEVNHKNFDTFDNRIENLEWNTSKENHDHSHNKRVAALPRGEKQYNSKLTEEDVKKIKRLYRSGKYSQCELGDMFGVTEGTVYSIIHNKSWKHIVV